jgi:Zn-finger nucleic acid-binding protein
MTDRSGIEIDYCPTCRGVWLDRGELDKIIERAAAAMPSPEPPPSYPQPPAAAPYPPDYRKGHPYGHGHDYRYKKKKSFLSEIFDFD